MDKVWVITISEHYEWDIYSIHLSEDSAKKEKKVAQKQNKSADFDILEYNLLA